MKVGNNVDDGIKKLYSRISKLNGLVNGLQFTDSSFGEPRLSSINTGGRVKTIFGEDFKVISNLRVSDHNLNSVIQLIEEARITRINGVLIILGDKPKYGSAIKSVSSVQTLTWLRKIGVNHTKLYLAHSFSSSKDNLEKKLSAEPDGIITQPVPSLEALYNLLDVIKPEKIDLIASVFVPSKKNELILSRIRFDWTEYHDQVVEFTKQVLSETNKILISSPNDFNAGVSLIKEVTAR